VGWVVDAQYDFVFKILPGGRLYVRRLSNPDDVGAESIIPTLERAVALLHASCDNVTYTMDWHHESDEEIDAIAPDPAKGTYSPHCMGMSGDPVLREGAALIPEIRPLDDPLMLERDVRGAAARAIALEAIRQRRSVCIHKYKFSVFLGAPGIEDYLEGLEEGLDAELEIIICGVATDVCVKQALEGFLARGNRVTLISDAIYGLGLEEDATLIADWRARGVTVRTLDEHFTYLQSAPTDSEPIGTRRH
jgi:nicotinamidase-related amidase